MVYFQNRESAYLEPLAHGDRNGVLALAELQSKTQQRNLSIIGQLWLRQARQDTFHGRAFQTGSAMPQGEVRLCTLCL